MQIQQTIFRKQEKGWIAMRTDLRKYLVKTTKTNAQILDYLMDYNAFDINKSKTIPEISEALQLHKNFIGKALMEMEASGWLLMYKKGRVKYYYINKERAHGLSQTVLPQSVTCKTKVTKPKKEKPVNSEAREIFDIYLKLYPKEGLYKYREEKIERAIKDHDFETIKSIVEWFPKNTWWNEKGRVDLYNNILAPTRIDDWISQMSLKSKPTNGHVTPIFRNDPRMEAKLRLERQEREHEKLKQQSEFNVLEELGGF